MKVAFVVNAENAVTTVGEVGVAVTAGMAMVAVVVGVNACSTRAISGC